MFFNVNGALHRVLIKVDDGIWAISYDNPAAPCYISEVQFSLYERVPALSEYLDRARPSPALTDSQKGRLELVEQLLQDGICITDSDVSRKIASEKKTTVRRVLRIYYCLFLRTI